MRYLTVSLCALTLNLTAATLQADWPEFHLMPLGGASGRDGYFHACGINNHGQVAGYDYTDQGERGYFWDSKLGMMDLGVLDPEYPRSSSRTRVVTLNNAGQVIGYSGSACNDPFIWDAVNGIQDIIGLPTSTDLHDINDSGRVVGRYGRSDKQAFVWDAVEGRVELSDPEGVAYPLSEPWSINSAGQIVGSCSHQAILWDSPTQTQVLFPPPTSDSGYSLAMAINDSGQMLGYYQGDQSSSIAFFWDPDLGVFDLGYNDGITQLNIQALNNQGQVVGHLTESGRHRDPFIWDMVLGKVALDTLVDDSAAGWQLEEALDINDQGQIVGIGYGPNGRQAFILTPAPEPVTGLLLLTGAAGILHRRRRRV